MSKINTKKRSWTQVIKAWLQPKMITMLLLGFSAGLPLSLIFGTLSLWLTEAGVSKASVTFFSWAALGYSFKFVWAPLVDRMPLPLMTDYFGRRRSWLLIAQVAVVLAISLMALVDPTQSEGNLTSMALAAVFLGFSSATQDIVIDAYRIECAEESYQALLASMYIAGYRIGMIVSGAGALFLASYFGSNQEVYSYKAWQSTYLIMASTMIIGIFTTLIIKEPNTNRVKKYLYSTRQYLRFFLLFLMAAIGFSLTFFVTKSCLLSIKVAYLGEQLASSVLVSFILGVGSFGLALVAGWGVMWIGARLNLVDKSMAAETYIDPVKEFFMRYGGKTAVLLLSLVGCYRLSDVVLGVVANVFYHDLGFTKYVIGGITKGYGLVMVILGGFLGGVLTMRYGVYTILFLGALLSSATNLLFMLLAQNGADLTLLTVVISLDNLSAGLAATAFVAFLSSLTSISFTAVQYALFSSVMTLFPKLVGGYSGSIVETVGYERFFLATALMGIPVLFLVWISAKKLK